MFEKDYYRILQVHPDADPEVVQAAYRRLARKYHPDGGGEHAHMQELNEAYAVLADATQRRAYNRWYRLWRRGVLPTAPSPAAPPGAPVISWLRALMPTVLTMLLLVVLVLDLLRLGLRGVPEITLLLVTVGWLVYHFSGLKERWK